MKRVFFFLLILIISSRIEAQEKIIEKSGKMPSWVNTLESGFIITSAQQPKLEDAKQKALNNIKEEIVRSVADHIRVKTEINTRELSGDVNSFLETYQSTVTSESGDVPFLQGISLNKVSGWYWEKIKDKVNKKVFYQYYIKYPFTEFELNELIDAYKRQDRELTERLNTQLVVIDNTTSLDELILAHRQLTEMTTLFKDQRKYKVRAGIASFRGLLQNMRVSPIENIPGKMIVVLQSGNRVFIASGNPKVSSPCAEIFEVVSTLEGTLITYNYEYCLAGSDENTIDFLFVHGNLRLKDRVRFDVTKNKVDFYVSGPIVIVEQGDKLSLRFVLKSKFETPFTISRIELEQGENTFLVFDKLTQSVKGSGEHTILAQKNIVLTDGQNQLLKDADTISGRVFFTIDETGIKDSYRVYKSRFRIEK